MYQTIPAIAGGGASSLLHDPHSREELLLAAILLGGVPEEGLYDSCFAREPRADCPMLFEEEDEQEWLADLLLTTPQGLYKNLDFAWRSAHTEADLREMEERELPPPPAPNRIPPYGNPRPEVWHSPMFSDIPARQDPWSLRGDRTPPSAGSAESGSGTPPASGGGDDGDENGKRRVRVQLTFRNDGEYVSKKELGLGGETPTNWVLRGVSPEDVQAMLLPDAEQARSRHQAAVEAGRAFKTGGPRARIQITELDGGYVRQGKGRRRRPLNESLPGVGLETASVICDAVFSARLGARVRSWEVLAEKYRIWTEGNPPKVQGEGVSPGDPRGGSDTVPKISPNTVQPTRPDLCGIQWDAQKHKGYWVVATGEFLIVRSLHETPEAAQRAAAVLAASNPSIVTPEGAYSALKLLKPMDRDAVEAGWEALGAVADLLSKEYREALTKVDAVLDGRVHRMELQDLLWSWGESAGSEGHADLAARGLVNLALGDGKLECVVGQAREAEGRCWTCGTQRVKRASLVCGGAMAWECPECSPLPPGPPEGGPSPRTCGEPKAPASSASGEPEAPASEGTPEASAAAVAEEGEEAPPSSPCACGNGGCSSGEPSSCGECGGDCCYCGEKGEEDHGLGHGDRVWHDRHGFGTVGAVRSDGGSCLVDFDLLAGEGNSVGMSDLKAVRPLPVIKPIRYSWLDGSGRKRDDGQAHYSPDGAYRAIHDGDDRTGHREKLVEQLGSDFGLERPEYPTRLVVFCGPEENGEYFLSFANECCETVEEAAVWALKHAPFWLFKRGLRFAYKVSEECSACSGTGRTPGRLVSRRCDKCLGYGVSREIVPLTEVFRGDIPPKLRQSRKRARTTEPSAPGSALSSSGPPSAVPSFPIHSSSLVGCKVRKRSGRSFKSGRRANTVAGARRNGFSGKPGFTFEEDASVVDQEICEPVSEPVKGSVLCSACGRNTGDLVRIGGRDFGLCHSCRVIFLANGGRRRRPIVSWSMELQRGAWHFWRHAERYGVAGSGTAAAVKAALGGAAGVWQEYERIGLPIAAEDILPLLGGRARRKDKREIQGMPVKVGGTRLGAFAEDVKCASCSRIGTVFYIERTRWNRGPKRKRDSGWHLNLYAVDSDGTEVLMTRDHIVPQSKGGPDHPDNCQTMCWYCNQRKADQ